MIRRVRCLQVLIVVPCLRHGYCRIRECATYGIDHCAEDRCVLFLFAKETLACNLLCFSCAVARAIFSG
jgi:hypothetical protein